MRSKEEEKLLWHQLAEIIIANSQREIEEWLKENSLFDTYQSYLRKEEG